MVNFEKDVVFEPDFDLIVIANMVVDTVLKKEKCNKECEVELLITDSETIRNINSEYRNIDSPTDVLSFPNIEWDAPVAYESEGYLDEMLINPDTGLLMLGQIVLNKDRIISQAEEFGHSVKREYAFLIAHSMLHLLGYDHMEVEEAKVMEAKQSDYLDFIGITRD